MPHVVPVLLLLAAIVAAGEIMRRLHLLRRFMTLGALGNRARAVVMRKNVSDHSKERATRILGRRMMLASLAAGGALIVVILPVILLLLADGPLPLGVQAAFLDWPSRILLVVLSLTYAVFRWRFGARRLQPG